MSTYEPILLFDTDSEDFVRGFEAGRIWQRLRSADVEQLDGQVFHATNAEMVIRMLDALELGGEFRAEFVDDTWMTLRKMSP